ncbi:capsule biosynthesis protein [Celeribacter arenosi]|uniref:Capsule polysaccharide transporter n=1 Tax=Celeribacter arenosi TaxID=792649 RepID=A0ABP7K6D0_9RHOB
MNTKVKAQKFRLRRAERTGAPTADDAKSPADDAALFDNAGADDGFGDEAYPGSAAADTPSDPATKRPTRRRGAAAATLGTPGGKSETDDTPATPAKPERASETSTDIETVRREGLTGRQLRMARRVAQKHGIETTSDFEAVLLLRQKGIDPFQRNAMLELVSTEASESRELTTTDGNSNLPAEMGGGAMPSKAMLDRLTRDDEISRIQQDIARRRRRKMLLLVARLAVFVGIPTLIAGYYFYKVATPLYATSSAFVIQQSEAPSASGGLGGLLSGGPLSGAQDSISVQDYLESRDAMLRLDADVGFKEHFSSEAIDPIQRLPENPSNEQAYKVYGKHVTIGYDPTEGLLRMEVVAADPETSQRYSEALIQYAEERIDQSTERLREDGEKGARQSLEEAERKMLDAQERVVALQEQLGIISPDAETSAVMGQIGNFETQLQEKKLQLQQLLDNTRPNQARVDGVRGDIRRLEAIIADLRSQLTQEQGTSGSLARISAELRMTEVELQTRQALVSQAVQALETARVEASRQVRYLSLTSRPIAPDEPTYPRKFENTLLAMLIFSGIYLMASLTAAVLREQVSG